MHRTSRKSAYSALSVSITISGNKSCSTWNLRCHFPRCSTQSTLVLEQIIYCMLI